MSPTASLDFKEIRERVDLRDLLRAEGIAIPDRIRFSIRCPFPDHEDSSPSCVIKPTGFNCYGCGRRGSVLDYIQIRYGYQTLAEAARHIVEGRPNLQASPKLEPLARAPHPRDTPVDDKLEKLLGFFSTRITDPDCAAYLASRGLRNLRALREARVGFSTKYRRVVFPVFHWRDGHPVALNFSGRAIEPGEAIRYRQFTGTRPTTAFMAGTTPAKSPERLVIVEGQIDALSAADVGVPAIATAGAGRLEPLLYTLDLYPDYRPSRVILIPDNDKVSDITHVRPSLRMASQIEELFAAKRPGTPVVRVEVPAHLKDANDWLRADRAAFAEALVKA